MKLSIKPSIWLGGTAMILLSAMIALFSPQKNFLSLAPDSASVEEVGWKLLQSFDYEKNIVPPELEAKLNTTVKIPGFAVPLASQYGGVDEILFVPNQLACIHVPAPPPHLVIHVKLREALPIDALSGPLWLTGVLKMQRTDSVYGAAAFEFDGVKIRPYTYN